jgi:hypothetical protein
MKLRETMAKTARVKQKNVLRKGRFAFGLQSLDHA